MIHRQIIHKFCEKLEGLEKTGRAAIVISVDDTTGLCTYLTCGNIDQISFMYATLGAYLNKELAPRPELAQQFTAGISVVKNETT